MTQTAQPASDFRTPEVFRSPRRRQFLVLPEGWPLYAFVALFPLWWLLGISSPLTVFVAIPMAWTLRHRRLAVPPGFGLWLLFLVWVVASSAGLFSDAPGTLHRGAVSLLPAYIFRLASYVSATIVLLYVCNASGRFLTPAKLLLLQVVFFVELLIFGLLALALPSASFTAPLAKILPASVASSPFFQQGTKLTLAQVQDVLGHTSPRPAAPFPYSNTWGEVITLVLVWTIAWAALGGQRRRAFVAVALLVTLVPTVASLNRGMWVGMGVAVLYVAYRLARQGRIMPLVGLAVALAIGVGAVLASPLATTIQERLDHGHSNRARSSISQAAVTGALAQPVLGYGSTRDIAGSAQTITVGRDAGCPQCGNAAIGGAGHLWLVLFAQGFPGVLLYVGFFLRTIWAYRRDPSPVAIAGSTVMLLGLVFSLVYGHVGMPLMLYMLAAGLMWRAREGTDAASAGPPAVAVTA